MESSSHILGFFLLTWDSETESALDLLLLELERGVKLAFGRRAVGG